MINLQQTHIKGAGGIKVAWPRLNEEAAALFTLFLFIHVREEAIAVRSGGGGGGGGGRVAAPRTRHFNVNVRR